MFACIYFEKDNTVSVIRKGHRDLKCDKFEEDESCVMKWGNTEFEGIILTVSDKEAKLKKLANSLVKEVLHQATGDPIPLLREFIKTEGQVTVKKRKVQKEEVSSKKNVEAPKKSVTYAHMGFGETSLTETWRLINQESDDMSAPQPSCSFQVSENMISILKQLTSQDFQKECGKLINAFESQSSSLDSRTFINMEVSTANTETMMPSVSCLSQPEYAGYSTFQDELYSTVPPPLPPLQMVPTDQGTQPVIIRSTPSHPSGPPELIQTPTRATQTLHFNQSSDQNNQSAIRASPRNHPTPTRSSCQTSLWNVNEASCPRSSPRSKTPKRCLDVGSSSYQTTQSSLFCVNEVTGPRSSPRSKTPKRCLDVGSSSYQTTQSSLFCLNEATGPRSSPRSKTPKRCLDVGSSSYQTTQSSLSCVNEATGPRSSPRSKTPKRCLDVGSTTGSPATCESPGNSEMVRLVENSDLMVKRAHLRQACSMALKHPKKSFTLLSKLLPRVFSTRELAMSRGQGLAKAKEGDMRPSLDENKMQVLKEYVLLWTKKHMSCPPEEKELNTAVTQQIHYARQKLQGKKKK